MAKVVLQAPPGFTSQVTRAKAGGRYYTGNLLRWRQGELEKIAGWLRLSQDIYAGFIRRMHAWLDLSNNKNLLVGSDGGLQLFVTIAADGSSGVADLDIGGAILADPRKSTWWLDNMGEDGLALATGGPLWAFHPGSAVLEEVATAPSDNNGMVVGMPQAQAILWGTQPIIGTDPIDPLLLRFSDAGGYDSYTATVSNQAGSYRLSAGSRIIAVVKAPQTLLVFTDTDVWSMSYIGPPLIYGFTIMGTGCGLIAPHAVVTFGRTTFWQSAKGLWMFGDSGVQPLPCAVHDYIFEDIDVDDIFKCHAGANSIGNEVTFWFPSKSDPYFKGTDTSGEIIESNECTHYVKYTLSEPAWDSGKMARTAWINQSVFGMPLGADLNMRIQQHEKGFDDDDQPMRNVYAESGFTSVQSGGHAMSVDQCAPDFKWFGKGGAVNLTLIGRGLPGGKEFKYGPYSMTENTQFFNPRARAGYIAVRYDWAARKGFSARVGAVTMQVKQAGRRVIS